MVQRWSRSDPDRPHLYRPQLQPFGEERDRLAWLLQGQDVQQRQIVLVSRDREPGSLSQSRVGHQAAVLAGQNQFC